MSRTSLRKLLERRNADWLDRSALVTPKGEVSFGELVQAEVGKSAARVEIIHGDNALVLVRDLVRLDGEAERLVVLPPGYELDQGMRVSLEGGKSVSRDSSGPLLGTNLTSRDLESLDSLSQEVTFDTEWVIATSGTTGSPKLVAHSLGSLAPQIDGRSPGWSESSEAPVWGLLYDMTRFAGFQVLLLALLSGTTLVAPDTIDSFEDRIAFLAHHGVTHLSATPTLWRKILMSKKGQELDLRQITLGGEAADQKTLDLLASAFPGARITHTYASTEAGLGFWVSDGLAGFPSAFLRGQFRGVSLRLIGNRLFLRSDRSAKGFLTGELPSEEGWIDTGDLVQNAGDRFFVVGRVNGSLNVGGVKVWPESIRLTLLDHDFVADAVVYGKPNPITGSLVAADIVLRAGVDADEARRVIREHCSQKLEKYEVPRFFNFVESLETEVTGKVKKTVDE